MKTRYLIWGVCVILFCVFRVGETFSHDDPGEPDTVRFGDWSVYVTGPPYQGKAIVPVVVFNDEPVVIVDIPLRWTGPLWGDSGKFVGERAQYLMTWAIRFYNDINKIGVVALAGEPYYIPPGEGEFVRLYFSVLDTGFVTMDSTFLPWQTYGFTDTSVHRFFPKFFPTEFHIQPSLSGDANGDGAVGAGDVVFLINYLFRQGPPPDFPEQGDINGDCIIESGDIVYLLNYLYRNGPPPPGGCAH